MNGDFKALGLTLIAMVGIVALYTAYLVHRFTP